MRGIREERISFFRASTVACSAANSRSSGLSQPSVRSGISVPGRIRESTCSPINMPSIRRYAPADDCRLMVRCLTVSSSASMASTSLCMAVPLRSMDCNLSALLRSNVSVSAFCRIWDLVRSIPKKRISILSSKAYSSTSFDISSRLASFLATVRSAADLPPSHIVWFRSMPTLYWSLRMPGMSNPAEASAGGNIPDGNSGTSFCAVACAYAPILGSHDLPMSDRVAFSVRRISSYCLTRG